MNPVTIEVLVYAIRVRRRNARRFRQRAHHIIPDEMFVARAAGLEKEALALEQDLYRLISDDSSIDSILGSLHDPH